MTIKHILAVSAVLAVSVVSSAPAAYASRLTITPFPEKLIVSAGDNRSVALIAAKDGSRMPGVTMEISVSGVGGTIDQQTCSTDDSGQCLVSYTAPATLGSGAIRAMASLPGSESGETAVIVQVVEVPTLSDSGWQCDKDQATFSKVEENIPCSDACSIQRDCRESECPAGSDTYCYSAQEACNCSGIGTTGKDSRGQSLSSPDGSTLIYALASVTFILSILAVRNYLSAKGDETRFNKAKRYAFLSILMAGITLIVYAVIQVFAKLSQD